MSAGFEGVCYCVQLYELNFEFLILNFKKVLGKPFLQPTSITTSDVYHQKPKRNVGNCLSSGGDPRFRLIRTGRVSSSTFGMSSRSFSVPKVEVFC